MLQDSYYLIKENYFRAGCLFFFMSIHTPSMRMIINDTANRVPSIAIVDVSLAQSTSSFCAGRIETRSWILQKKLFGGVLFSNCEKKRNSFV